MIQLRKEVNKSEIMREVKNQAVKIYKDSYQPDLQALAFIQGAEMIFDLLRLHVVSKSFYCDGVAQAGETARCKEQCSFCIDRRSEQQLVTKTEVKFDLIDRIKILFGAVPEIEVKIWIPTTVERYNGTSNVKLIKGSKSNFTKDRPDYGYEAPSQ